MELLGPGGPKPNEPNVTCGHVGQEKRGILASKRTAYQQDEALGMPYQERFSIPATQLRTKRLLGRAVEIRRHAETDSEASEGSRLI